MGLVEGLVATLEQVQLGIEQFRVGVTVRRSVLIAQEAEQIGPALRRELAVKYDDGAFLACRWTCQKLVHELFFCVDVFGVAYVASVVFVGVARVYYDELVDLRVERAIQDPGERSGLDHVQIGVFYAGRAGQYVETRAVSDEASVAVRRLDFERLHDQIVVLLQSGTSRGLLRSRMLTISDLK